MAIHRRTRLQVALVALVALPLTLVAPAARPSAAGDGELLLVDTAADGQPGRGAASGLSLTPDSRYALLLSEATNLPRQGVPAGVDGPLLYRKDLRTGAVVQAAGTVSDGTGAPCAPDERGLTPGRLLTPDGRYTVFAAYGGSSCGEVRGAPRFGQVYVHDLVTGRTRPASTSSDGRFGDNRSAYPSISDDGRWVVYQSSAHSLEDGDRSFHTAHVYVHDMRSGLNRLVDHQPDGTASADVLGVLPSGNVLSGDGTRLVYLRLRADLSGSELRLVDLVSSTDDLLARDVARAELSRDGRRVSYQSTGPGAAPVVRDLGTGRTWTLAAPRGSVFRSCTTATSSSDGQYAVYNCLTAPTQALPNGASAIFRRDLRGGAVLRVDATGRTTPARQPWPAQEQIGGVDGTGDVLFTSSWPGFAPQAPRTPHVYLRTLAVR